MRFHLVTSSVAVWFACVLFANVQAAEPLAEKGETKLAGHFFRGTGERGKLGKAMAKMGIAGRSSATAGGLEKGPGRSSGGVALNSPEGPDDVMIDVEPTIEPAAKKSREAAEPREGWLKKMDARKRVHKSSSDAPTPIVSEDGSDVNIPDIDIPGEVSAKSSSKSPASESTSAAKPKFRWPFARK